MIINHVISILQTSTWDIFCILPECCWNALIRMGRWHDLQVTIITSSSIVIVPYVFLSLTSSCVTVGERGSSDTVSDSSKYTHTTTTTMRMHYSTLCMPTMIHTVTQGTHHRRPRSSIRGFVCTFQETGLCFLWYPFPMTILVKNGKRTRCNMLGPTVSCLGYERIGERCNILPTRAC